MGMFDYVNCEYPLPIDLADTTDFHTKDTPNQCLDRYTIDPEGNLWVDEYDVEYRSKSDAKGLEAIIDCMTRVNQRRTRVIDLTGAVDFYTFKDEDRGGWVEFSANFVDGKLQSLRVLEDRDPPD